MPHLFPFPEEMNVLIGVLFVRGIFSDMIGTRTFNKNQESDTKILVYNPIGYIGMWVM